MEREAILVMFGFKAKAALPLVLFLLVLLSASDLSSPYLAMAEHPEEASRRESKLLIGLNMNNSIEAGPFYLLRL
jgi:hypothetical protein